jgi:uncharacterized protein with LGFP repeats
MRKMLFWPAACVLQLTNSLFAHAVVLNDGLQFSGTFFEGGSRQVTLKLQDGSRRSLDPDGVQSLPLKEAREGTTADWAYTAGGRGGLNAQTSGHAVAQQFQAKWLKLGGERGRLGAPTSDVTRSRDGGSVQHFERGGMYWSSATGVQEVSGEIFSKYAAMGEERSVLGYPTSDTSIPQDKVGRYSHFQRGMIWWNPSGGVHAVMGGILDQWKSMGYERSRLGYPTSDEGPAPDRRGRIQQFQGGSVYGARKRVLAFSKLAHCVNRSDGSSAHCKHTTGLGRPMRRLLLFPYQAGCSSRFDLCGRRPWSVAQIPRGVCFEAAGCRTIVRIMAF